MHIQKIKIKNFRLLEDVELSLEKKTTVIVGRNNSGKTSLTELFRRLLNDKFPSFKLEDFSLSSHDNFLQAYEQFIAEQEETTVRKTLPVIEIGLSVDYESDTSSYGPLSEFIIDLNPACNETLINVHYQLGRGKLQALFDGIKLDRDTPIAEKKEGLLKEIRDRVPKLYQAKIYAQDPNDQSNQKDIEVSKLHVLLQSGFINAQRGLADAIGSRGAEQKQSNILGSILEQLFSAANNSNRPEDQQIIADLQGGYF